MADLLDNIKTEIAGRMEELRPAVVEYEAQETFLAILEGDAEVVATTRQRKRTKARRVAHHQESMARTVHKPHKVPVRFLNDEQVAEIKVEARSKRIGLAKLMEKHGYVKDTATGFVRWRVA